MDKTLRTRMVQQQIVGRGVKNPKVLEAMTRVNRAGFVPLEMQERAFDDGPLPIGHQQTISQPYIVARMTELLQLSPEARVLEVGTGSGYQTAILAELAREVYTVELVPELAGKARERLEGLGYTNIHFRLGDGRKGWPEAAPFDAILAAAAPLEIPPALKEQLKEGGRMVIPVGRENHQSLRLLIASQGKVEDYCEMEVRFVPMGGEEES